jgi:hypothetical protein
MSRHEKLQHSEPKKKQVSRLVKLRVDEGGGDTRKRSTESHDNFASYECLQHYVHDGH